MLDFRTEPYPHQLKELEMYGRLKHRGLLWHMRLGKSKTIVDTACLLCREKKIDSVFVFAPNGVHLNWAENEIPTHAWDSVPYSVFTWVSRIDEAPPKKMPGLRWYCFPISAFTMPRARKLLGKLLERTLLVFDESHDYRSPGSIRGRAARALATRGTYTRILTGTPIVNTPLHAWGQFELLRPKALGYYTYKPFERRYAVLRRFPNVIRPQVVDYQNLDELYSRMDALATRLSRTDVLGLPDLRFKCIEGRATAEQARIDLELRKYMRALVSEGKSVAILGGLLFKAQQVSSGFLLDEDGRPSTFPSQKLDLFIQEVVRTTGRVAVWCMTKYEVSIVTDALTALGRQVVHTVEDARAYMGGMPEDPGPDFVSHPKTGGIGLQLSAVTKIFWYSLPLDATIWYQANERASITSRKSAVEIVTFSLLPVDRVYRRLLENKEKLVQLFYGRGQELW